MDTGSVDFRFEGDVVALRQAYVFRISQWVWTEAWCFKFRRARSEGGGSLRIRGRVWRITAGLVLTVGDGNSPVLSGLEEEGSGSGEGWKVRRTDIWFENANSMLRHRRGPNRRRKKVGEDLGSLSMYLGGGRWPIRAERKCVLMTLEPDVRAYSRFPNHFWSALLLAPGNLEPLTLLFFNGRWLHRKVLVLAQNITTMASIP